LRKTRLNLKQMVRQIAMIFLGLVLIFLVIGHMPAVIGLLQMFVDAAQQFAHGVAKLINANSGVGGGGR